MPSYVCKAFDRSNSRADPLYPAASSATRAASILEDVTIHLVDGTYELFRHFYAMPSARNRDGEEIAAVRGVMYSLRGLVKDGATHIGVATDHVIESFRNNLWPGYKTGEGIDPALWAQFPLLEEGLRAWGLTVWPMVEFEADDALATAAAKAELDPRVEQVIICSPDKDFAQCVRGTRVVQRDRVRRTTRDEAGVVARFGVRTSLDSRLSRPRRRHVGRLPWPSRLGTEVGRDRARQVRPHRRHSRRSPRVGRRCGTGRVACGDARA